MLRPYDDPPPDRWAWPKYLAGVIAAGILAGVANKIGEWMVEEVKEWRKQRSSLPGTSPTGVSTSGGEPATGSPPASGDSSTSGSG
jgi:hypothetical protein